MNDLRSTASGLNALTSTCLNSAPIALPLPRTNIVIRPGVLSDVPFLDSLQKLHTKQVGWMPRAQFEGKIKLGHVLIAVAATEEPVGYCIGNDQYFKRDDVGIIYQMNVLPGKQRGLIGAALLQAMFERSAWGCRLYCCWCAQDIAANKFWEAMGFVPLAFRTGSRTKGKNGTPRVHIFWQKRIRKDDVSTPWWFLSQTGGGSIREDRIVLPIPPGTHWSDAKPMVLPGEDVAVKALPSMRKKRAAVEKAIIAPPMVSRTPMIITGGLRFGPIVETAVVVEPVVAIEKVIEKVKTPRVKQKNDPRLIAAARELRDRWLDEINGEHGPVAMGKYDVGRRIGGPAMTAEALPPLASSLPALPLAA